MPLAAPPGPLWTADEKEPHPIAYGHVGRSLVQVRLPASTICFSHLRVGPIFLNKDREQTDDLFRCQLELL